MGELMNDLGKIFQYLSWVDPGLNINLSDDTNNDALKKGSRNKLKL